MTKDMEDLLCRQLDAAQTAEETDRALKDGMKAVIHCQRVAGDNIKEMRIERDREKARREGAKWLWGVLTAIASAGGGSVILKAMAAWQ